MGRLPTYLTLKPMFEHLYDAIGLSNTQAMGFDNRLFSLCCSGVTKARLRSFMDSLREAAKQRDAYFVSQLSSRLDEEGAPIEADPLDRAQSIFDIETDYDDAYEDGSPLYQRTAPPPHTYTHSDWPPFGCDRPPIAFMECWRCGLEADVLFIVVRQARPYELCHRCFVAEADRHDEKGQTPLYETEVPHRYGGIVQAAPPKGES